MIRPLRALALYGLLTVGLTWPMVTRLHIMDAGDSAFFAWQIGWEIHALKTDILEFPHGNIFHPLRYTLAFDEPVIGTTVLILPLALFTDDAVWLFNVARLLTFVFSGFTAYLLARELGCRDGAALVAGTGFGFSLIKSDQIAHLSTLGTQWLPLVVLFTYRYTRTGRLRHAMLAGLFYVLSTLACGYHGLIGAAVLPLAALPLVWGQWRLVVRAIPAMAVVVLALLPLYALHQAGLEPLRYVRGSEETTLYSASLETFLATQPWNWIYGELTSPFRTAANELFAGLVRPALIAAAAWLAWRERRRPSAVVVSFLVMGLAAALIALGPEVRWRGTVLFPGPFAALRELIPAFQMIRVPSRAGAFIALAVSMLFARALLRWQDRWVLLTVTFVLFVGETLMIPIPMPEWAKVVDTRRPPPPVYTWLAKEPGDFAVVELPILDIRGVFERAAYHESIYMVHSTRHWKRLLNGYAGIEPPHYVALREKAKRFPSAESIGMFRSLGARYVILHWGAYGPFKSARISRDLNQFREDLALVGNFGSDSVFQLTDRPPEVVSRE
jgi:hypothetical protein